MEPLRLDDRLEFLSEKEFTALADYHEREAWVWQRVWEHSGNEDDKEIYEYHRARVRNFKELAAEESRLQDEWEQEQKQ